METYLHLILKKWNTYKNQNTVKTHDKMTVQIGNGRFFDVKGKTINKKRMI